MAISEASNIKFSKKHLSISSEKKHARFDLNPNARLNHLVQSRFFTHLDKYQVSKINATTNITKINNQGKNAFFLNNFLVFSKIFSCQRFGSCSTDYLPHYGNKNITRKTY